ncbi:MAG: PEP-CTERM sorting domain-containing protein [Deltaproteobacteria bacterium]|nr:PEP-CTERM sorting domain-containing protein [Deltaproteobacteria bacterium]
MTVSLLLLWASPGYAALVFLNDASLPSSADGNNITRDTSTGLEWLDVDVSVGRTFGDLTGTDGSNEFTTGGDFEGFRYATMLEFTGQTAGPQLDSLMLSFNMGIPSYSFIGGYALVRPFLLQMGCFASCAGHGYAWGALVDGLGAEDQIYVQAFTSSGFNWGAVQASATLSPAVPNNAFPLQKGNWLVRAAPEPGTGLLVAMGLAALASRRRRAR